MRRHKAVRTDLDYLQAPDEHPQGVNTLTLMAELMLDIREILLDLAERQGVDVESHFLEEPSEEDLQPEDDGAGVSEVRDSSPAQDPANDGDTMGSDSWFANRATELRVGLHDQPDP